MFTVVQRRQASVLLSVRFYEKLIICTRHLHTTVHLFKWKVFPSGRQDKLNGSGVTTYVHMFCVFVLLFVRVCGRDWERESQSFAYFQWGVLLVCTVGKVLQQTRTVPVQGADQSQVFTASSSGWKASKFWESNNPTWCSQTITRFNQKPTTRPVDNRSAAIFNWESLKPPGYT